MMKSVLFATARMTPPFYWGGAEKSNLTLALRLISRGIQVSHFGSYIHYYKDTSLLDHYLQELSNRNIPVSIKDKALNYRYLNNDCIMVTKNGFLDSLTKYLETQHVDLVIAMLENAPEVIRICKKYHIPVVLFVMDLFPVGIAGLDLSDDTLGIIFSSKFLAQKLSSRIKSPGIVYYPMFEMEWYIALAKLPKFITFINPIEEKGVEIFQKITEAMPEQNFLAVDGWRKVEKLFPKNVLHVPRQEDMRIIYSQTKLLLVPSICQEAFGRVIVEAGFNKIPSIASDVGGISEAVRTGGILIDQYTSVGRWVSAINRILSPECYEIFSNLAYDSAIENSMDWTDDFIQKFLPL